MLFILFCYDNMQANLMLQFWVEQLSDLNSSPASRLLCKHWKFTSEFLSCTWSFCITVVFILSISVMVNQFFIKQYTFLYWKMERHFEVWLPSEKLILPSSDFTMQSFVAVCGDTEFKIFLNMLLWKLLIYNVICYMHLKMVFHCFSFIFHFLTLPWTFETMDHCRKLGYFW